MAIKNEITTLKNAISPLLPGAIYTLQSAPKTPTVNHVQIEAMPQTIGNSETLYHYANDRTFRIVIYGKSGLDVITKAEAVGETLANAMKIKIDEEPGYMTLGSFSLSETFETSTAGIFAIIGMLPATVRKLRPQEEYDKIGDINVDISDGNGHTETVVSPKTCEIR